MAVVWTNDNGQTWHDYAATAPTPGCQEECYYWISTARQIDKRGRILGSFLQAPRHPDTKAAPLKFFSVPVPKIWTSLDYDGDGRSDPAFYRPGNGDFSWASSANAYNAVDRPFALAGSGDIPLGMPLTP